MTAARSAVMRSGALAPAAPLCAAAGRAAPIAAERLRGGRNNRVHRLTLEDGGSVVLKRYFRADGDARDRLGAEWAFLTLARERGVRAAPEPLACDRAQSLALLSDVQGEKLQAHAVTAAHVAQAAALVVGVNADPRSRPPLPPASEACFSVADHLRQIDARVARLARLDPRAPYAEEAARFMAEELAPAWTRVAARARARCRAAGIALDAPLQDGEIIASPSDFGFHNALWAEGRGLVFLDFEHAGLDDPAKLAGDFFACPEIPAPPEHFGLFASLLADGLGLPDAALARMRLLRDAYRIKWACIVLNDFLPADEARRRFAGGGDRAARCARQLAKARAVIGEAD